jgi:hypothetical protein
MTDKPKWDLEEVPFENNDPAGGWYLHFDTEADHEVLYMSKSNVSEEQANLIAASPELLETLKDISVWLTAPSTDKATIDHWKQKVSTAIAKATGKS